MYTRARRKKRTESMEATAGEREDDEEDDDNHSQLLKSKEFHHQRDLTTTTNPTIHASLSSLAGKSKRMNFFLNRFISERRQNDESYVIIFMRQKKRICKEILK